MMKQMAELGIESCCTTMRTKRGRRMLVKLRGGIVPFQIKMGRCQGVERDTHTAHSHTLYISCFLFMQIACNCFISLYHYQLDIRKKSLGLPEI